VQTSGYSELISFFNLAHRRLERYVVGVLWGEAFKRKKYFGDDETAGLKAEEARKELSADKDSDNFEFVKNNLGSKIDFIQLIKSLTTNKNIKIRNFNQDLLDLVNSKLDDLQPKFITDLEKIAEQTNDEKLKAKVIKAENKFEKLLKEKEDAQRKLAEEELKRKIAELKQKAEEEARRIAEEKQKAEEEARKLAEEKQKVEEERRRKAELDTLRKEKERAEAEIARLKAEAKAKKEAELRAAKENELQLEKEQNKYLLTTRASGEYIEDFTHIIHIISNDLSASLTSIISSGGKVSGDDIANLKVNVNKIVKLSSLLTKADIKYLGQKKPVNIIKFLEEYVVTLGGVKQGKLMFQVEGEIKTFVRKVSVLDLTLVFDNLISNSIKAQCDKIKLEIYKQDGRLIIDFSDNGDGLEAGLMKNTDYIFKQGITTTKDGSGIGLYTVKNRMENSLHGSVEFIGNSIGLKGATFRLIFR
jgi:signal transduction histidine kinase